MNMGRRFLLTVVSTIATAVALPQHALAESLEQMLDQYDTPTLWTQNEATNASSTTPPPAVVPKPSLPEEVPLTVPLPANAPVPQFRPEVNPALPTSSTVLPAQGSIPAAPPPTTFPAPIPPAAETQQPSNSILGFPMNLFGAPKPKPAPPPADPNPFSMPNLFKTFFGGDSSNQNAAQNAEKLGTAQSYMQTAVDQASIAESARERASSGSDKDAKLSAASEARYAASAARAAANSATEAAAGGTSEANDAASQARDAADRAQAAADQATANAEGGGW